MISSGPAQREDSNADIAGAIGVDLIEIKPKSRNVRSKSKRVSRVVKIKVVCFGCEWYSLDKLDEWIPTLLSPGQSE
jgi:hypothetical protein